MPSPQSQIWVAGFLPAARRAPNLSTEDLRRLLAETVAEQPELHAVPLAKRLFERIAGCRCDEAAAAHSLPDDVALVAVELETPGPAFEDCLRPTSLVELRAQRA